MSRRWLAIFVSISCLSGCSGVSPAQVGQTIGTLAGSAIAPGAGGMLGAAVGLLTGMLVQSHVDKVVEKQERQTLGDQLGAGPRTASASLDASLQGEPTRVWVDEAMTNGRVVAGHFDTRVVP